MKHTRVQIAGEINADGLESWDAKAWAEMLMKDIHDAFPMVVLGWVGDKTWWDRREEPIAESAPDVRQL